MIATRDRDEFLVATVIKLIKRRALPNLKNVVDKTHAADVARWFPHLRVEEKGLLFDLLVENGLMGDVLSELGLDEREAFMEHSEIPVVVQVLRSMATDDLTNVLSTLPEDMQEELLAQIHDEASEELQQLLQYEEKTAGYIMYPEFFAVTEDTTASAATERIREMADIEMVFYVYVVDEEHRLQGVLSLRQLVTTPPDTPVATLMTRRVYTVHTNTPQEEVARVVARYNLLAVPVLDENDSLVGIVTIDDVIDVIRDEHTEDVLKMAGTGAVEIRSWSIARNTRARMPWLFASWMGGIVAAAIIGSFEGRLEHLAALVAFIPIVMGMGGNVGTQSATIIVRGLATGEVDVADSWKIFWREFGTGAVLGGVYGVLLAAYAMGSAYITGESSELLMRLPIVVGSAVAVNMLLAVSIGTIVPMLCRRLRVDPAVAAGPFVTSSIDVIGIMCYLVIASLVLA